MTFNFDKGFQEKAAAYYLRDSQFVAAVGSLVQPDFFEDESIAQLVAVQQDYIETYGETTDLQGYVAHLKKGLKSNRFKIADIKEAQKALGRMFKRDLNGRMQVETEIAQFARAQGVNNATLNLVVALDNDDADEIEKALEALDAAKAIGIVKSEEPVRMSERFDDRAARRRARLTMAQGGGVTTGIPEFDEYLLPWKGWGPEELGILLGPPKAGKTAALMSFGVNAAKAGKKVFYASCEVSKDILSDRADSNITGIPFKHLDTSGAQCERELASWWANTDGELIIEDFASGTLKVSELRRILHKYKSEGIDFDLVIVDYIDEMSPEFRDSDRRHDLAAITRGLRALAHEFHNAFLTATQTNREGSRNAKRNVTTGEDVSEDYNKIRIADAIITINASEDDREQGEVVLYLSNMRNAESGIRLRFKQDFSCWRFITDFVGRDG